LALLVTNPITFVLNIDPYLSRSLCNNKQLWKYVNRKDTAKEEEEEEEEEDEVHEYGDE